MHEKTVEKLLQNYEKSKSHRLHFEDIYDEIFEFTLPQRQGFKTVTIGERRDDRILDLSLIHT